MPKPTVHVNLFERLFQNGEKKYEWVVGGRTGAAGFLFPVQAVFDFIKIYKHEAVEIHCPKPPKGQDGEKSERRQIEPGERRLIKSLFPSFEFGNGFEFLDDSRPLSKEDQLALDN